VQNKQFNLWVVRVAFNNEYGTQIQRLIAILLSFQNCCTVLLSIGYTGHFHLAQILNDNKNCFSLLVFVQILHFTRTPYNRTECCRAVRCTVEPRLMSYELRANTKHTAFQVAQYLPSFPPFESTSIQEISHQPHHIFEKEITPVSTSNLNHTYLGSAEQTYLGAFLCS